MERGRGERESESKREERRGYRRAPCYSITDLIKLMRMFRSRRGQQAQFKIPTLSLTLLPPSRSLYLYRRVPLVDRVSKCLGRECWIRQVPWGSYSDDEGQRNWVWILLNLDAQNYCVRVCICVHR